MQQKKIDVTALNAHLPILPSADDDDDITEKFDAPLLLIPALPVVNSFQIAQHYLLHDDEDDDEGDEDDEDDEDEDGDDDEDDQDDQDDQDEDGDGVMLKDKGESADVHPQIR